MNDAEKAKRERKWTEFFEGTGAPWTEAEKLRLRLCTAAQWCEIAGKRTDGAEEAIANIMAVADALTELDAQPDAPERIVSGDVTYPHRNGETEPPTQNGWFGFYGEHRNATFAGKQYAQGVNENSFVLVGGDEYHRFVWDGDCHQLISDYVGRWWGPLLPPWEQEVTPE